MLVTVFDDDLNQVFLIVVPDKKARVYHNPDTVDMLVYKHKGRKRYLPAPIAAHAAREGRWGLRILPPESGGSGVLR